MVNPLCHVGAQHSHQKSLHDLSLYFCDLICYSPLFFFHSVPTTFAFFLFTNHQAHRFLKALGFAGPMVGSLIIHSPDMTCALTSFMSLLKEDPTALNKSTPNHYTVLFCCVLIHYYSEHLNYIIACKFYIYVFSYFAFVPDFNTWRM